MTPLQEFIEVLKIHRDTAFTKADENEGKQNHYYYIVRGDALTDAISNAESMLEKEKEVIKKCIVMGMEFIPVDPSRYEEDSELIFKETFKTKER